MALIEEAHKAAKLLLDHAYVRILVRDDPDAACAAALLAHALRRENVDFHVSWLPRLDEAALARAQEERLDALVLVGLGGDAATAHAPAARAIVLERGHAGLEAEAVLDLAHSREPHARFSTAGLAYLVAVAMSRRNRDLAPLAVAGALAAGHHVGGLRDLDAEIAAEAEEAGVLERERGLALHGATLLQALAQLDHPYVAGLTGRARNVKKLVADLKLAADAPPQLAGDAAERLGSFLTLRLLAQEAPDAALDALFRPRYRALQGPHTGLEMGELARLVEGACAAGRCGLGFAALWPEPSMGGEILDAAAGVRDELVAALMRAEREARREGPLLVVEAPRAALAPALAERAAAVLSGGSRVVLARHADGEELLVALRTFEPALVLLKHARAAATACGGGASGDAARSRVRIPLAEEGRFLKALAEAISA